MKRLLALVFTITPGVLFAHPGHSVAEQAHSFLHIEHIAILLALAFLVYVIRVVGKK